jgi:hypothetical protein
MSDIQGFWLIISIFVLLPAFLGLLWFIYCMVELIKKKEGR